MRLLIECTNVYDHPFYNSGIQRVVRNIVLKLDKTKDLAASVPVILKNHQVYEVKRMRPDNYLMYLANRLHYRMIRARELFLSLYEKYDKMRPFCSSLWLRRGLFILCKSIDILFHYTTLAVSRLCHNGEIGRRIVGLDVQSGDVLILLDASWHPDFLRQVEALKAKGVSVVSAIYDVIPLTHPQFCNDRLVAVFQRWFQWASQVADGFMAISRTTRDQAQAYATRSDAATPPGTLWFDYFHLGSELDLAKADGEVRAGVRNLFQDGCPVYLMVGTIEPRKNHDYLLKAFDLLRSQNPKIKFCFVGKIGWKCDEILRRIRNHPDYNRRVLMFNDLNDTELEYCYRNARSLVFPAHVEGFGLPLVEAMQRGLPAMASDIPVFHEVGSDFIAYFHLEKPESLADLVLQYEKSGKFPAAKHLTEWSWLNWEESARQFISRIASHLTSSSLGAHDASS